MVASHEMDVARRADRGGRKCQMSWKQSQLPVCTRTASFSEEVLVALQQSSYRETYANRNTLWNALCSKGRVGSSCPNILQFEKQSRDSNGQLLGPLHDSVARGKSSGFCGV
jgi:hypothetical protein